MDCDSHIIDNPLPINHDLLIKEDDAIISSFNIMEDNTSLLSALRVDSAIDYSIADFSISTESEESVNCSAAVFDMQCVIDSLSATVSSVLYPNNLLNDKDFFLSSSEETMTVSLFEISGTTAQKPTSVIPEFLL